MDGSVDCYLVRTSTMFTSLFPLVQLILVLPVPCAALAATFMCGACTLLVRELEWKIAELKTGEKVQVGSFRIDDKGNQQGINKIPYARSEVHIHEILEDACFRSKEYALVVNPTTGKGVYVPRLSTDLNGDDSAAVQSKLQNACSDFLDDHEDELVNFLKKEHEEPIKEFCHFQLKICTAVDMIPLPPRKTKEPKEVVGTDDDAQMEGMKADNQQQAEDTKSEGDSEVNDEL